MHDEPGVSPSAPAPEPTDDLAALVARGPDRSLRRPEDDPPASPWICPFLRAIDEDDALFSPVESPDPVNRCTAIAAPVPQSLRQQELVCLTASHVHCPRYVRGVAPVAPVMPVAIRPVGISPAIAGSLALFAAACLLSVGFVLANGGLTLTAAVGPSGSSDAGSQAPPAETAAPADSGTPSVIASGPPADSPSAPIVTATPAVTPSATATPSPAPTPAPTPTAAPSSDRYALLTPCAGQSDCWVYVIRKGDNLSSICNYFGVPIARVREMNAWLADSGLRVGRELRIPTPTR